MPHKFKSNAISNSSSDSSIPPPVIYCQECQTNPGHSIRFIDGPVCEPCSQLPKYNFITKTDAKQNYLIKDADLDGLQFHQVMSSYGRRQVANLFNKQDIMNKACERHSTTLDDLPHIIADKKHVNEAKSSARRIKKKEAHDALEAPRRNQLVESLNAAGLELRADSKLCQLYIEGKTDNLDQIVRRMCEMHYLYEYCHMDECREEAYNQMQEERKEFGYCDWLVQDKAEKIALGKYAPRAKYPVVFPWQ